MPRSFLDSHQRRLVPIAAGLCALVCLMPGHAARAPTETIDVSGNNQHMILRAGSMTLDDVILRQAPDTLITANNSEATGLSNGYDNGRWKLTGKVHIEYQGMVLDADNAVVVFADKLIQSIDVQGKPAVFSQPSKTAGQRNQGHSEAINFDAGKRLVRFTGHTWYSFGSVEGTADKPMFYNLDTTELFNENNPDDHSRLNFTFKAEKKGIPTPRTPERSTAQ